MPVNVDSLRDGTITVEEFLGVASPHEKDLFGASESRWRAENKLNRERKAKTKVHQAAVEDAVATAGAMIKIMGTAAASAKCAHGYQFNQLDLAKTLLSPDKQAVVSKGICFGLSVEWLVAKRQKTTDAQFFAALNSKDGGNDSPLLMEAVTLYEKQGEMAPSTLKGKKTSKEIADGLFWHSRTGFFPAWDETAGTTGKSRTYRCNVEKDMADLANWMAAAWNQRFFLLETKKHTMAGVGSTTGGLEFFDPAGGVVQAPKAAHLAIFFLGYFNNVKVKHYYGETHDGPVQLEVKKFKA